MRSSCTLSNYEVCGLYLTLLGSIEHFGVLIEYTVSCSDRIKWVERKQDEIYMTL
jgi:hypothetical protein